jgi:hypothetical protein
MSEQQEGQVYQRLKRLRNATDGREFMQSLINAYDKNEISTEKARALGYLIKIFLDTVEASDIEERIEELEKIVSSKGAA